MLGANFGRRVKIVAADRMKLLDDVVGDLAAFVDAEGADVDYSTEFPQPRGFKNIDRAENIVGGAGVRVFLHPATDQAGGVDHGVNIEFFQRC